MRRSKGKKAEKRSVSAPAELWAKADAKWQRTMVNGNISRYLQELMAEDVKNDKSSSAQTAEATVLKIADKTLSPSPEYKPKGPKE